MIKTQTSGAPYAQALRFRDVQTNGAAATVFVAAAAATAVILDEACQVKVPRGERLQLRARAEFPVQNSTGGAGNTMACRLQARTVSDGVPSAWADIGQEQVRTAAVAAANTQMVINGEDEIAPLTGTVSNYIEVQILGAAVGTQGTVPIASVNLELEAWSA